MASDQSLLDTLTERLSGPEGTEFECKLSRNTLSQSMWETISAFANTNGGWIVLGISEQNEVKIEGVANAEKLVLDLFNLLKNSQKISYPLLDSRDVSIEAVDDKEVVLIRVPAVSRKSRPIYINNNPYSGTYVRRHSGDFRCSKPEVDRMMREASDVAADSSIVAGLQVEDLDHETLAHYRRRYQTSNPTSPWNKYNDQRFLEAIGAHRWDVETNRRGITVAGLLMFGNFGAIRAWRSRHLIDYRLISATTSPETRWDDRIVWEGNLFDGYFEIYTRLTAGLPVPFRLEGGTRIDESPLHVVLREALVNLLAHTDYAETDASLIIRTPEQFSFRNPGSSRISENDLFTGDRSDPRNPELVRMFRHIGLAEEAGTGIPKIISAWRELGFALPDIETGTERYEFVLTLRLVHFMSPQDRNWLQTLGNQWTEAEQIALILARHDETIDNAKLRAITGQHPADVTKVLANLRSRGLLDMIGSGRNTQYHLSASANSYTLPLFKDDRDVTTNSVLSESGSVLSESNSVLSEPNSVLSEFQDDEEWKEMERIAALARSQLRLKTDKLESIILQLCSRYPLSLDEIAVLTSRDKEYLRRILRRLVAVNKLRYLHAEQPNHPKQQYFTGEPE